MKAKFSKRIVAYIIDMVIVYFLLAFISGVIPSSDKVNSLYQDMRETTQLITEKKVNVEEYTKRIEDITYEINRETVIISIINIIIYLIYFVVIPIYNNGQTFGKKIYKIKIISNDEKELNINRLLIRAFVLYNIAINIISLVLIISLSKSTYIFANNIIGYTQIIILMSIVLSTIVNKDGRGLHDILSKTKVIEE